MRDLERLIAYLAELGLGPEADDLADALWLAARMGAPATGAAPAPEAARPELPGPIDPSPPGDGPPPAPEPRAPSSGPRAPDPEPEARLPEPEAPPAEGPSVGALPIRVGGGLALPDAFGLARALRPLRRRVPSRRRSLLDEEATVRRRAETRLWLPVRRPARERWLDLALVVDVGASMAIWRQTAAELALLLVRVGAFRDLRLWSLGSAAGAVRLDAGLRWEPPAGPPRSPRELLDPAGRRLVLVVSDCSASGWRSGEVQRLLAPLAAAHLVSVAQVLPRRLWGRSALAGASLARLRAPGPAAPGRRLIAEVPAGRRGLVERRPGPGELALPLLTLERESLGDWARLAAGEAGASAVGALLGSGPQPAPPDEGELSPAELVERFDGAASAEARRLAGAMAAVAPLNLPLMRLVQRAVAREPAQVHLAELLLSGLLRRATPAAAAGGPDDVQYDFLPGVAERLLSGVSRGEAARVRGQIVEQMQQGAGAISFRALLADPRLVAGLRLRVGGPAFAQLSQSVLRRLGGELARLAELVARADPATVAAMAAAARPAEPEGRAAEAEEAEEAEAPQAQAEAGAAGERQVYLLISLRQVEGGTDTAVAARLVDTGQPEEGRELAPQELAGGFSQLTGLERIEPEARRSLLGSALFSSPSVVALYREARDRAAAAGSPLRIRLILQPEEAALQALPWEEIYWSSDDRPSIKLDLLRTLTLRFARLSGPAGRAPQPPIRARPRMLVANGLTFHPQRAVRRLGSEIAAGMGDAGTIPVGVSNSAAVDVIVDTLDTNPGWAILLLICQADMSADEPLLRLGAPNGDTVVSADELAAALAGLPRPPGLVLLALHVADGDPTIALSQIGPRLTRAGIPAVLGVPLRTAEQLAARNIPWAGGSYGRNWWMPRLAPFFRGLVEHGRADDALAAAELSERERASLSPVLWVSRSEAQIWRPARVYLSMAEASQALVGPVLDEGKHYWYALSRANQNATGRALLFERVQFDAFVAVARADWLADPDRQAELDLALAEAGPDQDRAEPLKIIIIEPAGGSPLPVELRERLAAARASFIAWDVRRPREELAEALLDAIAAPPAAAPPVEEPAGKHSATLPRIVSLHELVAREAELSLLEPLGPQLIAAMRRAWERAASPEGADWLEVTIGQTAAGPRTLMLSSREDGAHGLIAGAVGAGKAELLTTLIADLARRYGPDSLELILVEGRPGGPLARFAGLPQRRDLIQGDRPAGARRLFGWIEQELERRQWILHNEGVVNLVAFRQRLRPGGTPPPPHLLIIVDEYPALLAAAPELAESLVLVGRRGRSLGVHLILASYEPGPLPEALQANLGLRIALRTASTEEAELLLGAPAAEQPPVPGRGYLRPASRRRELEPFQAAYAATPVYYDERRGDLPFYEAVVLAAQELAAAPQSSEPAPQPEAAEPRAERLELRQVLAYQGPAEQLTARGVATVMRAIWAEARRPERASWPYFYIDRATAAARQHSISFAWPGGGHLLAGGAATADLIDTLVASLAHRYPPDVLNIQIVGPAAQRFAGLPHLIAPPARDAQGRPDLAALLSQLSRTIQRRQELLAAADQPDLVAFRQADLRDDGLRVRHLIVLIDEPFDAIERAGTATTSLWAELGSIARNGPMVGVHLVLTVAQPRQLFGQLSAALSQRLALPTADEATSLALIGTPEAAALPAPPPLLAYLRAGEPTPELVQVAYAGAASPGAPPFYRLIVDAAASLAPAAAQPPGSPPAPAHAEPTTAPAGDLPAQAALQAIVGRQAGAEPDRPLDTWLPEAMRESWRANRLARALSLVGGLTTGDQPLRIDLGEPPERSHLLLGGSLRSGKTELLTALLTGLATAYGPDLLQMLLVDGSSGLALPRLAELPHVRGYFAPRDQRSYERLLAALAAERGRREALLAQSTAPSLRAHRHELAGATGSWEPLADVPYLLVVIDEYTALAERDRGSHATLAELAREGPRLGILLLLATHAPSLVRDPLAALVPQRMVLRCDRTDESRALLGDEAAAELPDLPGRGLLADVAGSTRALFQGPDASAAVIFEGARMPFYEAVVRAAQELARAGVAPPDPEDAAEISLPVLPPTPPLPTLAPGPEQIGADYERLDQVARRLFAGAETAEEIATKVGAAMRPLENGGWIGQGADAFFAEMSRDVMPALARLRDALAEAGTLGLELARLMQGAEQAASDRLAGAGAAPADDEPGPGPKGGFK